MSLLPANRPDELWWASERLRQRLIVDPEGVLRERGIHPPPAMPIQSIHEYVRVAHLLWIEGRLVPIEDFRIDPADEGLLLGKGLWESTRTVRGVPWLWALHVDRMLQSAKLLGIDLAPERVPMAEQVAEYVRALTDDDVMIRLNATAGRPGSRGMVWMSAAPLTKPPEAMRLRTMTNPVRKGEAYLLLKTFQYATRLKLHAAAVAEGYDSALVLDEANAIQEAAHANIFLRLPEGWRTPAADGGLLPGTVRQWLMEAAPVKIAAEAIPVERLAEASEAFLSNSNAGLVPVTQIDGYAFRHGPETRSLQEWIAATAGSRNRYLFANRSH